MKVKLNLTTVGAMMSLSCLIAASSFAKQVQVVYTTNGTGMCTADGKKGTSVISKELSGDHSYCQVGNEKFYAPVPES